MSEPNTPSLLPERDYEAIESAVMETERGRWFLAEYARRNRSADTDMLLAAIRKLESALSDRQAALDADPRHDQVRFDLMEMAATIAQTKLDIAAIAPPSGKAGHLATVTSELGSIVTAIETATYEILQGAEGFQEIVWRMRQDGADPDTCARIERHASEIFAACEFQDLTGQRIAKVVQVLEYIEKRLNSMIDIWGDERLIDQARMSPDLDIAESALQPGVAISQGDVDELMWNHAETIDDTTVDFGPLDLGDEEIRKETGAENQVGSPEKPAVERAPDAAGDPREPATAPAERAERVPGREDLMALSQDVRTILFS